MEAIDLGFSIPPATQKDVVEQLRRRSADRQEATFEQICQCCGRDEWLMAAAYEAGVPAIPGVLAYRDPSLVEHLDINVLRRSLAIPICKRDDRLTVAVANPFSREGVDYCQQAFTACRSVQTIVVPVSEIERALGSAAVGPGSVVESVVRRAGLTAVGDGSTIIDLGTEHESEPILEYIFNVLESAIDHRASDVHWWVEAGVNGNRLRQAFRINGLVCRHEDVPESLLKRIDAVLLSLIGGDREAAGRGEVLDESVIVRTRTGRQIPMRYCRMPTPRGYHVTLRILDKIDLDLSLGSGTLCFPPAEMLAIERFLEMNDGLAMISGATGSGKSTTLAAMLKRLAVSSEITMTVENPIETEVPNVIHQLLKDESRFVAFRRGIVRSDPDNIMIGEIRDREMCMETMDLAITGHLVVTTIHAVTAADILSRCKGWGVPIFDLLRVVRLLMAQRLVLVACNHCATVRKATSREVELFRLPEEFHDIDLLSASAAGCPECKGSGYTHRQVLAEVVPIDSCMLPHLKNPETLAVDVEQLCRELHPGLKSLREHGLDLLRRQVTDLRAVSDALNLAN